MEEKTSQEESFWEDLILLENIDDDSGDTSGAAEFLDEVRAGREKRKAARLRRALRNASKQKVTLAPSSSSPPPERSPISREGRRVPEKVSGEKTVVESKSKPSERKTPKADHEKGAITAVKPSAQARKRKRARSIELVAEALRVFDGLRFYFLPNDDIRAGRKIRIQRSRNHGATWIRDWEDSNITHVIVDNYLTYDDVLNYFKISEYPADRIFVNEQWIADCIHFRFLVEPDQIQYDVDGFPRHSRPRSTVSARAPEGSMQPESREEKLTSPPESHERRPKNFLDPQAGSPEAFVVRPFSAVEAGTTRNIARDALDKAIEATQLVASLPVTLDDSDSNSIPSNIGPAKDDSDTSQDIPSPTYKAPSPDVPHWQSRFSCMYSSTSTSSTSSPNALTIEVLQQMCNYYEVTKDHWRFNAYRKAITALKRHPSRITTKEEALAIPGIGDRLADKIQEIVMTNTLRRLESIESDPNDEVIRVFCNIYGANHAQAQKWFAQGFRTLDDLRESADLTYGQRIGLEYYQDFQTRIPRAEVEAHGAYIRKTIQEIDPAITVTIGGSYRRGNADSGDIDLLITKASSPIEELRHIVFDTALPRMLRQGYIKANLTAPSATSTIWHGAAALLPPSPSPSPSSISSAICSSSLCSSKVSLCRRIDIILVPHAEYGAALIYFTGNDVFNRSMRLLARKKGMKLNQKGLFRDVLKGQEGKRVTEGGELVEEGMSERRIFEVLGVPWRRAEERIC